MKLENSRILITGASGSVGRQLVHELNCRGIKPICHVRESSDTTQIDSLQLEKRVADLRNPQRLEALPQGIDLIFHTAAWVDFRQDRPTQFTGINTMAAVALYSAASRAGVKRFVHISSVAAVGGRKRIRSERINRDQAGRKPINEEHDFNLAHLRIPYILTKHAAEVELRKLASDSTTDLVIVNPSIVIVPSRSGDNRAAVTKRFFRSLIIPDFGNLVNLVDVRDLAPGIIAAAQLGRSGERYILGGDNITVRDLVLSASASIGKTPHLVRFPRFPLDLAARATASAKKILGRSHVSFYPDLVKLLDYDWAFSSTKARNELRYQFRSIHSTLDDLLTNRFTGNYGKPA